jgi:hypothetical protein
MIIGWGSWRIETMVWEGWWSGRPGTTVQVEVGGVGVRGMARLTLVFSLQTMLVIAEKLLGIQVGVAVFQSLQLEMLREREDTRWKMR